MTKKNSPSFEDQMKELEDIVNQMGKMELPLDKSIQLFEKGMKISKDCSKKLNQAEQKVQKIINSNTDEDIELEEFDEESKS